MTIHDHANWQPIHLYGQGLQPHLGREWACLPAWDATAVHAGPDAELLHPDAFRAQADPDGDYPNRNKKTFVFWNRHIDKRFHLTYPHATKDSPRARGKAIGDAAIEWDVLVEHRDRYLEDAGLTLESPPAEIAKCLADTFACDSYFRDKPMCECFEDEKRALNNAIEGLLYKSHCVGCAKAYVALVDSVGLPARNIGCGGHWVAEVLIDGQWHLVDSVGRHDKNQGLDLFFRASYMETYLEPLGAHGDNLLDDFRDGLWRRPNPQYHFTGGTWAGPLTLRYGTNNAFALYPESERWGFKSASGKRIPMVARAGGFYWPTVHTTDDPAIARLRQETCPADLPDEDLGRDYLYYELKPGEALRQSLFVGDTSDMECIELAFMLAMSGAADVAAGVGETLMLSINDSTQSLAALGRWPPVPANPPAEGSAGASGLRKVNVSSPADQWQSGAVNWIVLENRSSRALWVPCVPAVLEPYLPPLRRA